MKIRNALFGLMSGLLLLTASAATVSAQVNLVQNGSFESPVMPSPYNDDGTTIYYYKFVSADFFEPWGNAGGQMYGISSRTGGWVAQEGNQFVEVDSGYAGFYEQTLTTVPGETYTLQFWYAAGYPVQNPDDDAIRVLWGGTQVDIVNETSADPGSIAWTLHTYTVTATGTSTVLRFEDAGIGYPYSGGFLDNVSVVSTEAPPTSPVCVDMNLTGTINLSGKTSTVGPMTLHIETDTTAVDEWAPINFGLFAAQVRVTIPSQNISDVLLTTSNEGVNNDGELRYFEDNSPWRAGLTPKIPYAGIVVLGGSSSIGDPNVVDDPLPSFVGSYSEAPFVLYLMDGSTQRTLSWSGISSASLTSVDCAKDDAPPTANAGADFSADEGQTLVTLNGSLSSDPDDDPLTYAWTQLAGTSVTLSDPAAQQPTFTAPLVALGGETLSFELTVAANGESDADTVDITVVNVNHPPVADAGDDDSVAEGSPVTLDGEDSFDIDNDLFTYAWAQVGGTPTVTLTGADTAMPTFDAPVVAGGGAPGVVATLVFQLTVDDGYPQDAPAPGYTFANVVDSVTVEVTNLNNDPTAAAGDDQTVDENTPVSLSGALSGDPDSDPLSYSWEQTGGAGVILSGGTTATPSFTAPFVNLGGDSLIFDLTVSDGYGGEAIDTVVVHVQNANDPPLVSAAAPTIGSLWPPNHKMVSIGITGVSDPDNNATITIDAVHQDEPTNGTGDGDTAVDAIINADGTVLLRAERSGNGNGRVYHIYFTASDLEGSASGVVTVSVNKKKKQAAVDDGALYDSTL